MFIPLYYNWQIGTFFVLQIINHLNIRKYYGCNYG